MLQSRSLALPLSKGRCPTKCTLARGCRERNAVRAQPACRLQTQYSLGGDDRYHSCRLKSETASSWHVCTAMI
uniref:Uncharacterized protein n=1 Tax=Anguilla anguilla TaxID=7936 RepID=A0A0E9XDM9_ANGAN